MQSAIERYGVKKCGNIYVRNNSEHIAFDCEKIILAKLDNRRFTYE